MGERKLIAVSEEERDQLLDLAESFEEVGASPGVLRALADRWDEGISGEEVEAACDWIAGYRHSVYPHDIEQGRRLDKFRQKATRSFAENQHDNSSKDLRASSWHEGYEAGFRAGKHRTSESHPSGVAGSGPNQPVPEPATLAEGDIEFARARGRVARLETALTRVREMTDHARGLSTHNNSRLINDLVREALSSTPKGQCPTCGSIGPEYALQDGGAVPSIYCPDPFHKRFTQEQSK